MEIEKNIYLLNKISKNEEVEEERLEKLLEENEKALCLNHAMKFLAYSSKTKKELSIKLRQKGYKKETIEETINRLIELDLFDDESLAKDEVERLLSQKNMSKRAVMQKLMQKGIEKETIDNIIKDYQAKEEDLEYENALYTANKKMRSIRDMDKYKIKQKLYQHLSYKGFSYDVINRVVRKCIDDVE